MGLYDEKQLVELRKDVGLVAMEPRKGKTQHPERRPSKEADRGSVHL